MVARHGGSSVPSSNSGRQGKGVRRTFPRRVQDVTDKLFEDADACLVVAVKVGETGDNDQAVFVKRRGCSLVLDGVFAKLLRAGPGGKCMVLFDDDQTELVPLEDEPDENESEDGEEA